ncbi:endonuclease domain-containing protein [Aureimonas endophytica]|uniref:endonuclease domain-containing protein n=1 Tax=Aureimonas endophytica TaxID=2027858 RepID=UPI0027E42D86|nr:endonuclease domain-containing protein [Aureimonas endophytica]
MLQNARDLRHAATDAETWMWSELRGRRLNGFRFVRQLPIGPYIADFACRARHLIIELDGSQHADRRSDETRTVYLQSHGWAVLRFWNEEVLRERGAVCETILAVLGGRVTEPCDGGGLIHGLRFAPVIPSPASLRSAPSPDSGEGGAPYPDMALGRPA